MTQSAMFLGMPSGRSPLYTAAGLLGVTLEAHERELRLDEAGVDGS